MARRKKQAAGKASEEATAKVFWSGRSQAIRLPKEYRVSCREVRIHREGNKLVLEPSKVPVDKNGWPLDFWQVFGQVGPEFDVGDRGLPHERPDPLGAD
jgi:antitoxin VapB